MNKILIKITQNDENLCISIPKEILDDDECRVDVAVTPMPGSLEVNILITELEYEDCCEEDDDGSDRPDYPHYSSFLSA